MLRSSREESPSWAAYCHSSRGLRRCGRKPLPAGTTASVVIFPGVRYERDESSAPRRRPGVPLLRGAEARQELPRAAPLTSRRTRDGHCGSQDRSRQESRYGRPPARVRHEAADDDDAFVDGVSTKIDAANSSGSCLRISIIWAGVSTTKSSAAAVGGAVVEGIEVLRRRGRRRTPTRRAPCRAR